MAYLARKIARAKWDNTGRDYLANIAIRADAISSCIKTANDSLSLWECSSLAEDDKNNVVLALAAGMEQLDVIDIVWVQISEIQRCGISIVESPGETPINELKSLHRDVCNLSMDRLCLLAQLIKINLAYEQYYRRYRITEIETILCDAIKAKRLTLESLKHKVQQKIQSKLNLASNEEAPT